MINELWQHRKGRLVILALVSWATTTVCLALIAWGGSQGWARTALGLAVAGGLLAALAVVGWIVARLKLAIDYQRQQVAALYEAQLANDSRQASSFAELVERVAELAAAGSALQATSSAMRERQQAFSKGLEEKILGLERAVSESRERYESLEESFSARLERGESGLIETNRRLGSLEDSRRLLKSAETGLLGSQISRELEGLDTLGRDVSRLERRLWRYRRRQLELEDQLSVLPLEVSNHEVSPDVGHDANAPREDAPLSTVIEGIKRYSEDTRREVAAVRLQLNEERSRRIVAAARREAGNRPPQAVILIVCPNRTGSTWLLDAIRCHPRVDFEPTARVHRALDLVPRANRYPIGLVGGGELQLPIELRPGHGEMVPSFAPAADEESSRLDAACGDDLRYSIEKIHPEFFSWDCDKFLRDVERLEQTTGHQVRFLYRQRDPRLAIRSMIDYKRRDPGWYRSMSEEEVPSFFARTWSTIAELSTLRPGLVTSFEEQMANGVDALARVYRWLWPRADLELQRSIAGRAHRLTGLDARRRSVRAPFLGESLIDFSQADELWAFLDGHREALESCYESYGVVSRSGKGRRVETTSGSEDLREGAERRATGS